MKAAIDIGTNTVLLLIAEIEAGVISTVYEEQQIPRLGKGVDESRNINAEAVRRVVDALKDYKQLITERFPEVEEVILTATSAVRDARNGEEVLQQIWEETGYKVRLLSGQEEAEWTTAGALSTLDATFRNSSAILDIGGGSAEVAVTEKGRLVDSFSFDMGSVRYSEKFLHSDPPTDNDISKCRNAISNFYKERPFKIDPKTKAIGVAGTLTTLASILQDLQEYIPKAVNGYPISKEAISEFIEAYRAESSKEWLLKYPELLRGRSDIFLAGLLILEGFLDTYGLKEIIVSAGGIRHGAILKNS